MKITEIITEEKSRRDFLKKGLGVAAATATGISASNANAYDRVLGPKTPEGRKAYMDTMMSGGNMFVGPDGRNDPERAADIADQQAIARRTRDLQGSKEKVIKIGMLYYLLNKDNIFNKRDALAMREAVSRHVNSTELGELEYALENRLSQMSWGKKQNLSSEIAPYVGAVYKSLAGPNKDSLDDILSR